MKELEIYIDGASKGNPGPSGIGVVICHGSQPIKNIATYIGDTTNNIAEYTALIYGLKEVIKLKAEVIKINTDSQLLYRQLTKVYKVKSQNISGLYDKVLKLLSDFKKVSITNIPREKNRGADKLATEAVKAHLRKNRSSIKRQVQQDTAVLIDKTI